MAVDKPAEVIVIGSGLAGLSAGIYLQELGINPLILERNGFVGGRTSSWDMDGMQVESGCHRYLGFYSELPKLLRKAGLKLNEVVHWEDEIEIRVPDGPHAPFGASLVHKPFKTLSKAIGNNDFLTSKDKAALSKFIVAGLKDYVSCPDKLDQQTVQEYAEKHGVTKDGLDRMLVAITEGLFFLTPRVYSAYAFFGLIAPYWKKAALLRIGAFSGGMSEVMMEPIADRIHADGGTVVTSQQVSWISKTGGRFIVGVESGTAYTAKAVICAASLYPAQEIIRQSFGEDWFGPMLQMSSVPSVSLQLDLKEPAMPIDRATFGPGTALASFTEQSRTTFKDRPGRLSVILAPPERFLHLEAEAILEIVMREAKTLGVDLEDKVVGYRKVAIPYDFYLLAPGVEKLRPEQETPVKGFFLAGDYTKQKFLTTMEGAVYSGRVAAKLAAGYIKG